MQLFLTECPSIMSKQKSMEMVIRKMFTTLANEKLTYPFVFSPSFFKLPEHRYDLGDWAIL